jgi:transposase
MAIEAAHQVIAEVGPQAVAFPSAAQLSSWVGFCPGQQEGAGVSQSDRSPKGNRVMWRWIIQVAWAAVKMKDCRFQHLFRRLIPKLGKKKAIWAVADRCGRFFEGAASALKRLQTLPSAAW